MLMAMDNSGNNTPGQIIPEFIVAVEELLNHCKRADFKNGVAESGMDEGDSAAGSAIYRVEQGLRGIRKGVEQKTAADVADAEGLLRVATSDAVLPELSETIVAAACQYGRIVLSVKRPGRHHDIFRHYAASFEQNVIQGRKSTTREVQGFLTNTGRFVTREAAWRIAVLAKQPFLRKNDGGTLYSEDLW